MKSYRIAGHAQPLTPGENRVVAKLTKCRKPCRCRVCGREISPGETTLKTSQYVVSRQKTYYTAYCDDCFVVDNQ